MPHRIPLRAVLVIALLCAATPLRAQERQLAFFIGLSSNPAGSDAEQAMRASGYDDAHPFTTQDYPWSSDYGEFPWMLLGSMPLRHPFHIGLALGDSPLGETHGFDAGIGLAGENVNIDYGASFLAAEARFPLTSFLAVGAGPAVYLARASCDCNDEEFDGTTFGAVVDAALMLPFRQLRIGGIAQYRLAGSLDVGAWDTQNGTIQAFEADLSHFFAGIGVGLVF